MHLSPRTPSTAHESDTQARHSGGSSLPSLTLFDNHCSLRIWARFYVAPVAILTAQQRAYARAAIRYCTVRVNVAHYDPLRRLLAEALRGRCRRAVIPGGGGLRAGGPEGGAGRGQRSSRVTGRVCAEPTQQQSRSEPVVQCRRGKNTSRTGASETRSQ